ncbi:MULTISPECIES: phage gene 29 protein family protein [Nocardia]|uniref:phage gene 29 protein family protein n=1 Tax=Nocardia TaxID=1817 RepID=UPI000D694491|nr:MULTISPECIES: DUF2744 domain-containing protein [Nocardia]
MGFKLLENSDMENPEEHFAWALRNVPGVGAGAHAGTSIPPQWAAAISRHLVELGYVFGPYLAAKADAHGKVDISDIPQQTKKFQRPFRGQQSHYNPASAWVKMGTAPPPRFSLPDINRLTPEERGALLDAFRQRGDIPDPPTPPNYARVLDE